MSIDSKAPETAVMEEAAEWYWQIREPDVAAEAISAWQAWLHASAEHRAAFADIEAVLQQVDRAEDPAWPTEEDILGDAYDGTVSLSDWRAQQNRHSRKRFTLLSRNWAIAASLFLLVTVATVIAQLDLWGGSDGLQPDFAIYETRAAEHRAVHLPDGSSVTLGGKSVISVAYTPQTRMIILQQGAAFFEVAKDADRPFVVEAGGRRIAAVGTAFNVTRQDDRVVVTVTEGTVTVTPQTHEDAMSSPGRDPSGSNEVGLARLEAGHQMTYNETAVTPVTMADPTDAIAWREGRLKYRGESLRYVIEDVNRYADRPIALADESAADILFTGTVFQQSIDTWLSGLEQVFPVTVEETPDGVLIHHTPHAAP